MIIPEILEYLEESYLEDWLTAAFIENESQLPLDDLCADGEYRSASRDPDIWMAELTNRTVKLWDCRFNVEFSEERRNSLESQTRIESQTREVLFTLNTETAEVTFTTGVLAFLRRQDTDDNIVSSWVSPGELEWGHAPAEIQAVLARIRAKLTQDWRSGHRALLKPLTFVYFPF